MAGDSLGTMTVGVTANVSDAERALNSLASMLEKFDRQQQTRQRSGGATNRGAGGFFSPMSEEFAAEAHRIAELQKRTEALLRLRDIRSSETSAVTTRGTESQMSRLADEFRARQAREIDDLQVYAEQKQAVEKRRIDELQLYAEREEKILEKAAESRRAQQQREIDDLQVFAERQEAEERRLIDALQEYAEKEERIEKKRLQRAQERHQKEIEEENRWLEKLDQNEADRRYDRFQLTWENSGVFGDMNPVTGTFGGTHNPVGGTEDSANRARFAVMNLAYGVQDFAQTIGTGGFPAAVRASANNLTGLAFLFDKTAYASGGLKAALMAPEVAIIAVATGALLAADAWEKYRKKIKEAADEAAKAKFEKFDPGKAVREAGRAERFAIDVENAKTVAEAEKVTNRVRDEDRVKAKEERAAAAKAADLRVEKAKAEAALAAKRQADAKAEMLSRMGAAGPGGGGAGFERMQPMTQEERKLAAMDEAGLVAEVEQATKKLKEAEEEVNGAIDDRIQLLKELDTAERNLRRAKRDDVEERFNRQFAGQMREGVRNEEARIRIGRREFAESVRETEQKVMELERKARFDPFAGTGAAGRNTAAEYEALVRARAPGNMEANDLSAMKQLLQEQKEILRKIEENTKETYEGPPPTVDELINGV